MDQSNDLGGFIVMIDPDGTLTGSWGADYNKGENPPMNYVMNAEFEGNIDPGNIFFDEASMVIECKKIYYLDIDPKNFIDPKIDDHYADDDYHRLYFGEILNVLKK